MKKIQLFIKIIIAVFLGLILSILTFQNDPYLKKILTEKIKKFTYHQLDCRINFEIENINLFKPSLTLKNVYIEPLYDIGWNLRCHKFYIKPSSWFDLIIHKQTGIDVHLNYLDARSKIISGQVKIWPYMCMLLTGASSNISIYLKTIKIKKGSLLIENDKMKYDLKLFFNNESRQIGASLKTNLYLLNGYYAIKNNPVVEKIFGNIQLNYYSNNNLEIRSYCDFNLPQLDGIQKKCMFSGAWEYSKGIFELNNIDNSFKISPIKIYSINNNLFLSFKCYGPNTYLQNLILKNSNLSKCEGNFSGKLKCNLNNINNNLYGYLFINNLKYKNYGTDLIKIVLNTKKNCYKSIILLENQKKPVLSAKCKWQGNNGSLKIINPQLISMPLNNYWTINPKNLALDININKNLDLHGAYKYNINHIKSDKLIKTSGSFKYAKKQFQLNGFLGKDQYKLNLDKNLNFFYSSKNKKLIKTTANKKQLKCIINYEAIKKLLPEYYIGEGNFILNSNYKQDNITGSLTMKNGSIRLGKTYNFINNFNLYFNFNPYEQKISIHNMQINLSKGKILCNNGIFIFNNELSPTFIHMPIILHKVFFNWKKDLMAEISGNIAIKKKKQKENLIEGNITLEKSQLKKNIFSDEFRKNFLVGSPNSLNDIKFNLVIDTKKPIQIKTSFLRTSAQLDISIKNYLQNLDILGSIDLKGGILKFPYKGLNIINGNIYFLPNQLYDPIIEITARNQIKKYIITMRSDGSLQYPNISFESTPPLTEEQIIALLLSGYEDQSLNITAPNLILQNIKNIMFGPEQTESKLENRFKNLLKHLKHVKIIPTFSDQTGRGGFRGTIEIDVNDQIRALIQKNFSMPEDTKFELEYKVSDDINLRAIKDERGDLGAELEIRWKF